MVNKMKKKMILLYKTVYMYIFNILFCIVLFVVIYLSLNYHMATMARRSIKIVGEIQMNKVEGILENFRYESLQCATDSEVVSMEKSRVTKRLDFIKYYRSSYKDIIIINNKKELLSGYVKDIKEYMYTDYVLEALKGKTTMSRPINIEGQWYVDFVSPIVNNNNQLGIISLRISLNEISNHLKGENQEENIEVYIVDKEGYYLTSGKNSKRKVGEENININALKVDIDYAPKTPYRNYDGNNVYGDYHDLSLGEWTLVVESVQDKGALYTIITISMIIVVFIQFLMNKILNIAHKYREDDGEKF